MTQSISARVAHVLRGDGRRRWLLWHNTASGRKTGNLWFRLVINRKSLGRNRKSFSAEGVFLPKWSLSVISVFQPKLPEFISERFLSRKAKRMPFSVEHCFWPLLSVCRARACGTAAATRNYHLQIGSVRPSVLRSITRGNRRQSLSLPPQLHSSPCPFVWLAALVSRFPPGPVW